MRKATRREAIEAARSILQEWGKKGGKARAKTLTSEQRRQIAKKAAEARWGKRSPP